jgi:predicted PurR-regulated permease PerM
MILPPFILWSVSISIIVIALAILIRLIVYLIAGKIFMNKISHLTESIDSLVETLKEKTNDIGDQATKTLEQINCKINPPEQDGCDSKKWSSIANKVIAIGSIVFNFVQMFHKSRKGV